MKKFWAVICLLVGCIAVYEGIASYCGYPQKFSASGSVACGMAAIELGLRKLTGDIS